MLPAHHVSNVDTEQLRLFVCICPLSYFGFVQVPELLKKSVVLSQLCGLTPNTRHEAQMSCPVVTFGA